MGYPGVARAGRHLRAWRAGARRAPSGLLGLFGGLVVQIREVPAGRFPVKYENREFGRETSLTDSVPESRRFSRFFPVFPAKAIFDQFTRCAVAVGMGFSRSRFHP